MLSCTVMTQFNALGIPLWLAALATLILPVVRWIFGPPMDTFHRWRESKQRDHEYLLRIADHPGDNPEADWINEAELRKAFHQRYGVQAGPEERSTYARLVRRYSPSINWRHIRGISTLARRSQEGAHIELLMPVWQRRLRYVIAVVGISLYVLGSALWVNGLLSALHGSWAEIIVGAPLAIVAAVTTRAFLFPLQSYDTVAKAVHREDRPDVLLIPIATSSEAGCPPCDPSAGDDASRPCP